jgi:hypothetical protein
MESARIPNDVPLGQIVHNKIQYIFIVLKNSLKSILVNQSTVGTVGSRQTLLGCCSNVSGLLRGLMQYNLMERKGM